MKVLGLTGGTGAGKTTVLELLREKNTVILDCDRIYYELLGADTDLRREIQNAFGDCFLPDGELNRKKLGNLVYNDPEQMRKLNAVVYYYVGQEIRRRLMRAKESGAALCAIDAVNLLESGLGELCDVTAGVIARENTRIRRIMERDGIDEDYARSRIRAQKSEAFYRSHCKAVIENDGDMEKLTAQVNRLLADLMR